MPGEIQPKSVPACRRCGCTDVDCRQCIEKTGAPCFWFETDLCSACTTPAEVAIREQQRGDR